MMQLEGRMPALIVDPDREYLNSLSADPSSTLVPPVFASSGAEAQTLLSDVSRKFLAIFVNPSITEPGGLSVLRCAHLHHVGTPLFLLMDGDSPFTPEQLRGLAIQEAVKKPLSYAEIIGLVAPILPSFDAAGALTSASQNSDPLNEELEADDDKFSPIKIAHFLSGHRSFFDVYVRLSKKKFIKVLQAGDSFSEERIATYLGKGIKAFHVRRETHAGYVAYCDQLATSLLAQPKAPAHLKVAQVLNAGHQALQLMIECEVPKDHIQYAARFAANVRRLVNDMKISEHPDFTDFLRDSVAFDHSVGTALVAGLLLRQLGMHLERLQLATGMAALLHDVGLYKMAPDLEDKPIDELTPTELTIFRKHPIASAQLVAGIRGIDSLTVQAVYQHHERRNGLGFPGIARAGAISQISEVIGLADELLNHTKRGEHLGEELYDGFSFAVIEAYKAAFKTRDRS